jgi:RNA recognition motif-containing protein
MHHFHNKQASQSRQTQSQVIISNFPLLTTTSELSDLMEAVGPIKDFKMAKNQDKSKLKYR